LGKLNKKRGKISNEKKLDFLRKSNFLTDNYQQKAVLKHLQELAKNVKQIKNKLGKIEKRLANS